MPISRRRHRTIGGVIQFPAVPSGESMSISASLFVSYLACPGKALGQLMGIYAPETKASFSGILAHRIFARHHVEGPIDDAVFPKVCKEEIGQALNPKLASLAMRPSELRGVIAQVGELYARFRGVRLGECAGVEELLEVDVGAGVTLRGRIDAVMTDERGVRLVDWKTGSLGDSEPQLGFYALLWALSKGELPVKVEAFSIASGESFSDAPSVSSVTRIANQVAEMVGEMRAGFSDESLVAKRGGPACRYCALNVSCQEGIAAIRLLAG